MVIPEPHAHAKLYLKMTADKGIFRLKILGKYFLPHVLFFWYQFSGFTIWKANKIFYNLFLVEIISIACIPFRIHLLTPYPKVIPKYLAVFCRLTNACEMKEVNVKWGNLLMDFKSGHKHWKLTESQEKPVGAKERKTNDNFILGIGQLIAWAIVKLNSIDLKRNVWG